MKNIVRALTVTLALTGLFATSQASSHSRFGFAKDGSSVMIPNCMPSDPTCCGQCKAK